MSSKNITFDYIGDLFITVTTFLNLLSFYFYEIINWEDQRNPKTVEKDLRSV